MVLLNLIELIGILVNRLIFSFCMKFLLLVSTYRGFVQSWWISQIDPWRGVVHELEHPFLHSQISRWSFEYHRWWIDNMWKDLSSSNPCSKCYGQTSIQTICTVAYLVWEWLQYCLRIGKIFSCCKDWSNWRKWMLLQLRRLPR